MPSLVFFRTWPWPKVAALCGAWAIIVLGVWLLEFLRTRPELGANDFVYRASFLPNVRGWLLMLGPPAIVFLVRWHAAR
jgi:hypothetical protein